MSKKIYAYVGNWSFEAKPSKGKGISIFEYEPENGELKLIETICPEVAAGQLYLDAERGILRGPDPGGDCGQHHCPADSGSRGRQWLTAGGGCTRRLSFDGEKRAFWTAQKKLSKMPLSIQLLFSN